MSSLQIREFEAGWSLAGIKFTDSDVKPSFQNLEEHDAEVWFKPIEGEFFISREDVLALARFFHIKPEELS